MRPSDDVGAVIRGFLKVDPASEVAVSWTSPYDGWVVDTLVSLDLSKPADTDFRIEYRVAAGTWTRGDGSMRGELLFSNLPAETRVVSCWGYRGGQPVATARATWGRIKGNYR